MYGSEATGAGGRTFGADGGAERRPRFRYSVMAPATVPAKMSPRSALLPSPSRIAAILPPGLPRSAAVRPPRSEAWRWEMSLGVHLRPQSPKHDGREDETDQRTGTEPMEPSSMPFGIRRRRPSAGPRVEGCEVGEVKCADYQRRAQNHPKNLPQKLSESHRPCAETITRLAAARKRSPPRHLRRRLGGRVFASRLGKALRGINGQQDGRRLARRPSR